jgi:hypothetical protein
MQKELGWTLSANNVTAPHHERAEKMGKVIPVNGLLQNLRGHSGLVLYKGLQWHPICIKHSRFQRRKARRRSIQAVFAENRA